MDLLEQARKKKAHLTVTRSSHVILLLVVSISNLIGLSFQDREDAHLAGILAVLHVIYGISLCISVRLKWHKNERLKRLRKTLHLFEGTFLTICGLLKCILVMDAATVHVSEPRWLARAIGGSFAVVDGFLHLLPTEWIFSNLIYKY